MKIFHIDMNMLHFSRSYLEKWFSILTNCGYDTLLWELENHVQWETCPESVYPDAFSKSEFRAILDLSRKAGLKAIPLFQTIGHCEYVLKHEKYAELKELPERIDQYCPQNPDLIPFLHRWIDEYLELFGNVEIFHLGADEAWTLGSCPECRKFAEKHSLSQLYIDHVNAVCKPLLARGVKPAIWADMVLTHPEALDMLDRRIILFDWIYCIKDGDGVIQVWGEGEKHISQLTTETKEEFREFIFPEGDEPGRMPEPLYTADYLGNVGFQVVGCSASSSYGDNVFSPRNWFHVTNTFAWYRKFLRAKLAGFLQTSWSVHIFPWELQLPAIAVPAFFESTEKPCLTDYPEWFAEKFYGLSGNNAGKFWQAAGLLSKSCLFSHTSILGFGKSCEPAPQGYFIEKLRELSISEKRKDELEICRKRLAEYRASRDIFRCLQSFAKKNQQDIELWILAAENLANRAEISAALLNRPMTATKCTAPDGISELLGEMHTLREQTRQVYQKIVGSARNKEIISWIYDALECEIRRTYQIGE